MFLDERQISVGVEEYSVLADRLETIATLISKFPQELQEKVFDILVSELLDKPVPTLSKAISDKVDSETVVNDSEMIRSAEKRNYISEFKEFYEEKRGEGNLTDIEFATIAAYYFAKKAPPEQVKSEVTGKDLIDWSRLVKREPPASIASATATLNKGKNEKKWFEGTGRGVYVLNQHGEHIVENEFPKKRKK